MQSKLLGYLISMLIRLFDPEMLRDFMDMVLDWVEKKVLGSASTVDDAVVLPILKMMRTAFSIPKDDPETPQAP